MKKLLIDPPQLMRWMSAYDKGHTLVMFDLEADILDTNTLRFDISVAFNHVAVRRGLIQKIDYYVGTTGAEITAEFDGGVPEAFTEETTLDVKYTNSAKRSRESSLTMKPGIATKSKESELKVSLGSISWDEGEERTFSSSFACQERLLSPMVAGNLLRWVIALPRGEKAVRDFLLGNLYLFVECAWCESGCIGASGKIGVRPSDMRFFDGEKRPLSRMKSLSMLFCLWRAGIRIQHERGIIASFKVKQ